MTFASVISLIDRQGRSYDVRAHISWTPPCNSRRDLRRIAFRRPGTCPVRQLAVVERHGAEARHRGLCRAGDEGRLGQLRSPGRARRGVRQRRHPVDRAADLRPVRLHPGTHQGAGAGAPGMEGKAAVQGRPRRRHEDARPIGREGHDRAGHGHPCRHDDRRVLEDGHGLARHRPASEVQAALYRAGLSADGRGAGLSAGQRLQDLYRVGRRHRVHAALGGEGLRRSAGRSSAPRSRPSL
jgi:hypothetical protein